MFKVTNAKESIKSEEDAYEKAATETETEKQLSEIKKDSEDSIKKIGKLEKKPSFQYQK